MSNGRGTSRYAALTRPELTRLLPELLLIGHLIDRSGMAWCIETLGREGMADVAIDEWMAAAPIYTKRMQRALGFEAPPGKHGDVVTVFKGLQLDIGAPPQFMDFRYTVHDPWHGEFRLDHCGALMDVEPMGDEYVVSMCHDIEDPTFDATAAATNPRAQVRPVHRPPRRPADRSPHCAWTVVIDESHPPVEESDGCSALRRTRAATLDLNPIDPLDEGASDYAGPLLSDLDFAAFSHSTLVRMADEVCLQMHLLYLGFARAVRERMDGDRAGEVCRRQLVGIGGLASSRLHAALGLPGGSEGALAVLRLHPLLNPAAYVAATIGDELRVSRSPAHDDGAWIAACGPGRPEGLQAIVRAVDPHLDVELDGDEFDWTARVIRRDRPAPEADEVVVTRMSTGAAFVFEPRRSLPITPV
jgi:hypothetical protein